jgi:hypothetical protein
MSSTNISNISLIYNLTDSYTLSTSSANVLRSIKNANSFYKINTIRLVNFSASTVNVNMNLFDFSSNTIIRLANNLPIISKQTFNFSNVNSFFCLEEGDVIAANSSQNNSINIIVQYDLHNNFSNSQVLLNRYITETNNGTII